MPRRIVIVADVEPALVDALRNDDRFDVQIRTRQALGDSIVDAEILVTRTVVKVDAEVLARAPLLRAIAQGTSGIDNIDGDAVARRGIEVIHLPGINANAVAELVIGNIIALTRTVPHYTSDVRRRIWDRSDCTSRHELRHYRLGIIGYGNVGSRVARLATTFEMPVFAYDPYVGDIGTATRAATLEELITSADILTLHVPLTSETRAMIGEAQLRLLPREAIVINASRGEVLDVSAALAALSSNHIGGLALDVYDPEPPDIDWPDDPRLIVTPHIAGCTEEAKSAAAQMLYQKLVAWVVAEAFGG